MNRHFLRFGRRILAGLVLTIATTAAGQPVENRFVPDAGGDWNVAENWSLGHVPIETERVVILAGSTCDKLVTCNLGAPMTVESIVIGGEGATPFLGRLELRTRLFVLHDVIVGSGGTGEFVAVESSELLVGATLYIGSGSAGLFRWAPTPMGAPLTVGDCQVGYSSPGVLQIEHGAVTINSITISSSGRLNQISGTVDVPSGLTSAGEIVLSGGVMWCRPQFHSDGTFTLAGGAIDTTYDNPGEGTYIHARELTVRGPAMSTLWGGLIGESLTFDGPARLVVLNPISCSTIEMSASGTDPGQHDFIETLTGIRDAPTTLHLTLRDGYQPAAGDVLDLVRSEFYSEIGSFDLPPLGDGRDWQVEQSAAGLRLRVLSTEPCPGDVTGDNSVDIVDLATLLSHFGITEGATRRDGDLSGDGAIDLYDLTLLLNEFGKGC